MNSERRAYWATLAEWWHERYLLHVNAGRHERASIAQYRRNVARKFADDGNQREYIEP